MQMTNKRNNDYNNNKKNHYLTVLMQKTRSRKGKLLPIATSRLRRRRKKTAPSKVGEARPMKGEGDEVAGVGEDRSPARGRVEKGETVEE